MRTVKYPKHLIKDDEPATWFFTGTMVMNCPTNRHRRPDEMAKTLGRLKKDLRRIGIPIE